ncbi:MAG TPA: class I SAM-dependent methyltransferase [Burkholderiaceae bacterium]|jgi:SAM-dependent methyltransferase|nr:class I SAM-dependent methyltransferase [Burkholderiaceae bacterium]
MTTANSAALAPLRPLTPSSTARSYREEDDQIAAAIRSLAQGLNRPIRILEAGCGNRWTLDLGPIRYHVTGVDLDKEAIEIRQRVHKDLDEAIWGDLCTVELPAESFDVVYSAFVLEHVEDAPAALQRLAASLRPGGLLILRLPDPGTARGLLTRFTPFWVHVLYHRWMMKNPNAGQPGYAPYPTHYHPVIGLERLVQAADALGLDGVEILCDSFACADEDRVTRAISRLVSLLSAGRYTSDYRNLTYFFRKRPAAAARRSA